jgi:hypothetical protein
MRKIFSRRSALAALAVASLALMIANTDISKRVRAQADGKGASVETDSRARLKARLSSTRPDEFRDALARLIATDEPGALDVWQPALRNSEPVLRREAWKSFRQIAPHLIRKETVPQIVRIAASSDRVMNLARQSGLDATIWLSSETETIAAVPPFLIERFEKENIASTPLFDSVSEWQQARTHGDRVAQSITPGYQSQEYQVRIAVIDLSLQSAPDEGYAKWTGDPENIVFHNERLIAYLDVFPASEASDSHIREQYARRGCRVTGFYTIEEFSENVARLFPGETFGRRQKEITVSSIKPALAEGQFHNYEETLAEFTRLASEHANLARLVTLGLSYEGRRIFALKISNSPESDDPGKPDVLITGCHHAREWISVEPPVYFANQFINGYDSDDAIRHLVDNLEIWIVPILNPDGLTFSQGSPNDSADSTRLWRKTRRPVSPEGCSAGIGVDLNRNYDYQWRLPGDEPCPVYSDDVGASDNPESEIYRGNKPESEPEIKALKTLIDDPQHQFRAHLDYHNYSQLILYPWGYQPFDPPDEDTFIALASQMSREIIRVDRRTYRPTQSVDLYSTTGSSIDYAYGVNRVAAPFLIEMRPTSGRFDIPESQIEPINRENWAAARALLRWAVGPPILKSVKAYQQSRDGSFSRLVYSARWVEKDGSSSERELITDTRFPGLESGPLQVRLQFSSSMDASAPPVVRLGRSDTFDELQFASVGSNQGWQKTEYANDTWTGEAIIPPIDERQEAWRLSASASDQISLRLDALPQTIADYGVGTGRWRSYEDQNGEGSEGGVDREHLLAPTLRGEHPAIIVGSPRGGERLAGGEPFTVEWSVLGGANFVPAEQEIWLSTDGGFNYERILGGVTGNVDKVTLNLPRVPTTTARVRVAAREEKVGNSLFGDNERDFTICANVGSPAEIRFISSEFIEQSWADTSESPPRTGPSRLIINLSVANRGVIPIDDPFLRVGEVSREHVLLSRDVKSTPTLGARQSFDKDGDSFLPPGATAQVRLVLGLVSRKKFKLGVELYGVPADGQIAPASAVRVWNGKPRSR